MRDKLDGLSDWLVTMSRFPGLGFLEGHAESLTGMKHTVEAHISNLEAKKQGVEEGTDAVKGLVRRKKSGVDSDESTEPSLSGVPGKGKQAAGQKPLGGKTPAKLASGSSLTSAPIGSEKRAATSKEAKAKQKLAMRLLKRKR